MKKFLLKHKNLLAYSFLAIICICFFVYLLTLFGEYSSESNGHAKERADFYTQEQTQLINSQISSLKLQNDFIAENAAKLSTQNELLLYLKDYRARQADNDFFLNAFYLKGNEVFGLDGESKSEYPDLSALAGFDKTALSRIFQYENRVMAVAVCSKTGGGFADGVITLLDRRAISLSNYSSSEGGEVADCVKKSQFSLLCKYDGRIIDRIENSNVFEISNEPVQTSVINELFESGEEQNAVLNALSGGKIQSFVFTYSAENYVLSVSSFGVEAGNLTLVCAYKAADIYGEGFTIVQSISSALAGLGLVVTLLILFIVIAGVRARRKIVKRETVVPYLNCPTYKKFLKKAEEILKRHANSNFAFVSLQINNFGYVSENFKTEEVNKLVKYVADALRREVYLEETYGYLAEGEFALLLHYRDRNALTERLNGLYLRLAAFTELGENYKSGATFAAYEVDRNEKQTVRQMMDKLYMTKGVSSAQKALFSLSFYDDSMRKNYMRHAEIEGKMDKALKNSEFHLFYQPKYNLKKKNLDGCEILVRWYDPEIEKYHLPAEFLPVFEENGFIVKLDRFVFYKACENLSKRVENRQIFYPISVNVSRITAIQEDFVDYYVRIKNKFNVKDGFITLEFTESFAYENYEFLRNIVNRLHANGLLCSIDDFGTGYSSYNILKSIEMDEIKLDKFFLSKGCSPERDQTLLRSVIGTVKKLGMKVTQEGVETREDLYRLEELDCDVIQGYYFSKPMKYSDYCEFIDKNFI